MNSTNDLISDMLTRLRNASLVKKKTVVIPKSKMTLQIAQVLCDEGFINTFQVKKEEPYSFTIVLKYLGKQFKPAFLSMQRVSKPGRRMYTNSKRIPEVLGGIGVAILSTPQGILTDRVARKKKLGGEILCYIY